VVAAVGTVAESGYAAPARVGDGPGSDVGMEVGALVMGAWLRHRRRVRWVRERERLDELRELREALTGLERLTPDAVAWLERSIAKSEKKCRKLGGGS
jgi:hypothetical protein